MCGARLSFVVAYFGVVALVKGCRVVEPHSLPGFCLQSDVKCPVKVITLVVVCITHVVSVSVICFGYCFCEGYY